MLVIADMGFGGLCFEKTGTTTTKHIFMGPNRICSVATAGDKSFYHLDHLGSSNVITNQAGNLISNCEYLPYGEFSTKTGANVTYYYFTGKELDDETGLMFYGARYYDPQIGRFITPDTIVQAPYDPQSLNRYSYCRNNPINLTDPTGHKFKWKNFWQSVVSVITGIVSILCPVLAPVMWAVNMAISAYTAIQTGNILGFAGGIVGGAVFGALGKSLSLGLAGMMSEAVSKTFIGGALIGAVEFGMGGFGAGFGASLASGRNLADSMRAGAIGAAMGAVTGAIIEGSYRAEWQKTLHGASDQEIDAVQNAKKGLKVAKFFANVTKTFTEDDKMALSFAEQNKDMVSDLATFDKGRYVSFESLTLEEKISYGHETSEYREWLINRTKGHIEDAKEIAW